MTTASAPSLPIPIATSSASTSTSPITTAIETHQVEGTEFGRESSAESINKPAITNDATLMSTSNQKLEKIDQDKREEMVENSLAANKLSPKIKLESGFETIIPSKQEALEHEGNNMMQNSCCAGCREPIRDRFIFSVIDLHWHQDCVQCSDCSLKLIERCYEISGKLYCKLDYWRRFGPKCFACHEPIERSELVQRIKGNRVFHLKCFTCSDCNRQLKAGEQLHLIDGKRLLCKLDYSQQASSATHNIISENNNNNNNNSNNNNNNSNGKNSNGRKLVALENSINGKSEQKSSPTTTTTSTYFTLIPSGGQNQQVASEAAAMDKSGNWNNNISNNLNIKSNLDELGEEIGGDLDDDQVAADEREIDDEFDDDDEEKNDDNDDRDDGDNEDDPDELMNSEEDNEGHLLAEGRLRSFSPMSDELMVNNGRSYENLENEENRGRRRGKLLSRANSAQVKRKRRRRRMERGDHENIGKVKSASQPLGKKQTGSRNGESILNSISSIASAPPSSSILASGNNETSTTTMTSTSTATAATTTTTTLANQSMGLSNNQKSVSSAASTSSNSSSTSSNLNSSSTHLNTSNLNQHHNQQHSHYSSHQLTNHNQQHHSHNHHHHHHQQQQQNHHSNNTHQHQQHSNQVSGNPEGQMQSSGGGRGGHKPTRVRTVLNEKQLQTLRDCYAHNPRPDALMKEQLVEMTGLSPRVIRVWFQNKRCKDKKKSILYKQMQQHEKDGRHLAGLTLMRGVPMVAASPIQYDDHSTVSSTLEANVNHQQQQQQNPHPVMLELRGGAGGAAAASGELVSGSSPLTGSDSRQQVQHFSPSSHHHQQHPPPQANGPADIHAYQPPWENLIDYAQQQAGSATPSDMAGATGQLDPASPRYQQLISQVHGYDNGNSNSNNGTGNGNNQDQQASGQFNSQQGNFVALQPKELQQQQHHHHHHLHQQQQQQQHQQLVHMQTSGQPQMRQQLHQFGR